MSFGGSVKGMSDSLNNNKKLRRNHKAFDKQKQQAKYGEFNPLTFKKASPERLKELNEEVARLERKDKIANMVGGILVVVLLALLYSWFF